MTGAAASRRSARLQLAFYRGMVTVSERKGMLKTYELAEPALRLGRGRRARRLKARSADYLLDRALRSQGIVSLDSICHLDAGRKKAMRQLIAARVRRKELVPVELEGAGKLEHWARPESLEAVAAPDGGLVHILNPFDPLVLQRKRLQLFFGYEHRFEAYVPPEKRVFGYFAQPVLVGDQIVAVLDLKTDRSRGKLLLQKWTWIGKRARKARIEEALHRFERFQLA